ncbi:MAG: hypothetical protein HZC23_09235 [Rhodocyclales bacterium]|nr:hypothetical protein [Rhodocyclales bacterium]
MPENISATEYVAPPKRTGPVVPHRLNVPKTWRFATCAMALAMPSGAAQSQSPWHAARDGVEIKATALTRSALLAFYQARGFSAQAIAPYADACAFSFEVRNTGRGPLRLRLADWRAGERAGGARFMLPDEWDAEWVRRGVAEPARIAFRWAQFQAELEFAPGDWIMGMAALERRPPGRFRMSFRHRNGKESREVVLDNVTCAPLD